MLVSRAVPRGAVQPAFTTVNSWALGLLATTGHGNPVRAFSRQLKANCEEAGVAVANADNRTALEHSTREMMWIEGPPLTVS
jgi:hypothetical protein